MVLNMKRFCFFIAALLGPAAVQACPLIANLVDFNCDRALRVAVMGDSIVRGLQDSGITKKNGGYVLDLQHMYPRARFYNLGIPGSTSRSLLGVVRRSIRSRTTFYKTLKAADYVLIEVGTNDFWQHTKPSATVRNLRRLKSNVENFVVNQSGVRPIVLLSTLPQTSRGFQEPFIESVDNLLALSSNVQTLNVQVRFDELGTAILSYDRLHPSTQGYLMMARLVRDIFSEWLTPKARRERPDLDNDGVYDRFEVSKFLTNPAEADTDGDDLMDGAELFVYRSDPNRADTDGDGKTDGAEVLAGTDPLDPLS